MHSVKTKRLSHLTIKITRLYYEVQKKIFLKNIMVKPKARHFLSLPDATSYLDKTNQKLKWDVASV
jgi:hypothetical protein